MLTLAALKKQIEKLQKKQQLSQNYNFYNLDVLKQYNEQLEFFLLLNKEQSVEAILSFLPTPTDYYDADKKLAAFTAFLIKLPQKKKFNPSIEFIELLQRISRDSKVFTKNEHLNKLLKLMQYHKVISEIILGNLPNEKPEDYVRSVYQLFDTGKGNTNLENLDRVAKIKQVAPEESKKRETYLKEWVKTIETIQGYNKQTISPEKLLDLCIDVTKKLLATTLKNPDFSSKLSIQAMQHLFDLNIAPDLIDKASKITPKTSDVLPDITVSDEKYFICKLSHNDIRALFLGEVTGNCQHLGGAGATTAEYGYTKEDSCFYVMFKGKMPQEPIDTSKLKTKDIVSYAWTWQYNSNLVFDSIEVSIDESNQSNRDFHQNVRNLFLQLATKIVKTTDTQPEHKKINTVLVGEHQDTLKQLGIPKAILANKDIPSPELHGELVHTDADHQLLFYSVANEQLSYFANNYNRLFELINNFKAEQVEDLCACINLMAAYNDYQQLKKLFNSENLGAKVWQILDLNNLEILRIMQEKMSSTAIACVLWERLINSAPDDIVQQHQTELVHILAANLPNDEAAPHIELIEKYPVLLESNDLKLNADIQKIDSEINKIAVNNYLAYALLNKYGLSQYGDIADIISSESAAQLINNILEKLQDNHFLKQEIDEIPILHIALELRHYERILPILNWDKFDPKLLQRVAPNGENLLMTALRKGKEDIVIAILSSDVLTKHSTVNKTKALEYLEQSDWQYYSEIKEQLNKMPDFNETEKPNKLLFQYKKTTAPIAVSNETNTNTNTDGTNAHNKYRG